jgi:nucleotide-binding universal stress UspA family protein
MTPRIILVPLTGAGADEPVMAIATELAARFNAHVTALHVRTGVRGVIPLPPEGASAPLIERIAAATRAEIDFLHASSAVTAIAVDEGREGGALDPLIDYLAWHGVSAQAVLLPPGRSGVGARILAEAASRAASLLVMGAYTRSRLREWVLGGATRHVIAKATIPVLMAH